MNQQLAPSDSHSQLVTGKKTIFWLVGVSVAVLFLTSSIRHFLFQSSAFDLGFFDQAIYLISQGQPPIVSFWGFYLLGDHAAWILYFLAPLYKLYPSVLWLFALQAIALALGVLPAWQLAKQAGLKPREAIAIALTYLFYPLVFNVNLFDFHPEVLALPGFLAVVLAARQNQPVWFILGTLFILGCREALSLTVAAMGLWLLLVEKKRVCGAIALGTGTVWFLIATQIVIPHFRPLGTSVLEIAKNIILQPSLVFSRLFSWPNLGYLCLLLVPVLWGLSLKQLAPLLAAVPQLTMNLLTVYQPQKDLSHQYSVPILPFLLLAVIASVAANKNWIRSQRGIILWSLICFLALGNFRFFGNRFLTKLDTWQATREAIAQLEATDQTGSVLTNPQIAPHLTHRPVVQLAIDQFKPWTLNNFNSVLLDTRYPGKNCSNECMPGLLSQLQQSPIYQLTYQRDDVLFICL